MEFLKEPGLPLKESADAIHGVEADMILFPNNEMFKNYSYFVVVLFMQQISLNQHRKS